ncbi:MAG: DUF4239 domain-containing protein [Candidatus Eremiobacteraeota bacterium]|nr:DUF4239 domain-containing protein [Candidatus Eremiobacteraeota bacterium]
MIAWLESLPTSIAGFVIVGLFVVSTLVLGYLVAAFTSEEVRAAHTDRAGFILAVIGVVYAVLLAFVAVGVWERFQQAEARSYEEASAIATIYRDSESFPNSEALRAAVLRYVHSVIEDEWSMMTLGDQSGFSHALSDAMDRHIRSLRVESASQANIQSRMLAASETALADRQERLTLDFIGINDIMWVVLFVGAYITVGFTYFFGFDRTIMQQLMIGALSLLIGLVLFLIMALDFPYRGSIAVSPDAFRVLLESWQTR